MINWRPARRRQCRRAIRCAFESSQGAAMIPRDRSPFSAIVDRPPLNLPAGKVIVWTVVNLEVWDISRPMPRQAMPAPSGSTLLPDATNWSWHEYGMRVGVWRIFKLFERLGLRPTLSINARVCEVYERVAAQARDSGWEFMAHGYDQIPMHKLDDQRGTIHLSMDTIERFTGKRPVGWLGPGLTQTLETPDLLAEAGVRYIGDWVHDDEPTTIETKFGPLATLPYNFETHDLAMMALQHHESPYWLKRCQDTLDRYVQEAAERTKIMTIALHPYIMGQPHRIRYLEEAYAYIDSHPEVVHLNGEEILAAYMKGAA